MSVTTFSTARRWLGVVKEATQGTAVAVATDVIPIETFDPKDVFTELVDTSYRGSMAEEFAQVQGVGSSETSIGGNVYADSIGYLLAGLMGDNAASGTAAPFTWTFALGNSAATAQPPSYTFVDLNQLTATSGARDWPGQVVEELTFKMTAEGLFSYTGKTQGWLSVAAGSAPTEPALAQLPPLPVWRLKVGMGGPASGGTLVKDVTDAEITIKRTLEVIHTAQNTQNPYFVRAGRLSIAGKFTRVSADESELLKYLNDTSEQVQLVMDNGQASAAQTTLTFNCQSTKRSTGAVARGKEYVAIDTEFRGIANSTDAGPSGGLAPCKITLLNAVSASGHYI